MALLKKKLNKKKIAQAIFNLIVLLIFLTVLSVFVVSTQSQFETSEDAVKYIKSFGALGPIIVTSLIALEVVIAPIPGFIMPIASGYAFGAFFGAIYAYLGNVLGTAVAFILSRAFGRPLVERFIDKRKLRNYDCFFDDYGKYGLWVVFLFPIFPADIISFVAGLSGIKWKDFMFIISIAYFPNMFLLTYFGAQIFESGLYSFSTFFSASILIIALLIGLLVFLHMKKKVNSNCKINNGRVNK